jgi:hypothetical protein
VSSNIADAGANTLLTGTNRTFAASAGKEHAMSTSIEASNQPERLFPSTQWSVRSILVVIAVCGVFLVLMSLSGLLTAFVASIVTCSAGVALCRRTLRLRRFAAACAGFSVATVAGSSIGAATGLMMAFNSTQGGGGTLVQAGDWPVIFACALGGAVAGFLIGLCTIVGYGAAWLVAESQSTDA